MSYSVKLQYSKRGRKASINLPLIELRALGWKAGDKIKLTIVSGTNSIILQNVKRDPPPLQTYQYRKGIMEKGFDSLLNKDKRKLMNGIKNLIFAKAQENQIVLRNHGFNGRFVRWKVIDFLKKNKEAARRIGAHMNLEWLQAYETEKMKGLLPAHILDIEADKNLQSNISQKNRL